MSRFSEITASSPGRSLMSPVSAVGWYGEAALYKPACQLGWISKRPTTTARSYSQSNAVVLEKLLCWWLQALFDERDDELHELARGFFRGLGGSAGSNSGDDTYRNELRSEDDERGLEEPLALETTRTVP
jgi:hypothetical protein